MAVPTKTAVDFFALHRPVTRHYIFDVAGEKVPMVGEAVGERWPVVEHILVVVGPLINRGLECPIGGPTLENSVLDNRQIGLGINGGVWLRHEKQMLSG